MSLEVADKFTSYMAAVSADEERMTGTESYRMIGTAVPPEFASACITEFKGLYRQWDCVEKARIVAGKLDGAKVVVGAMLVFSRDMRSSYGYYFRPPFELHAWVRWYHFTLDFALPGVIEKGLTVRDHVGPVLIKRKPMLLAGHPPHWIKYEPREVLK